MEKEFYNSLLTYASKVVIKRNLHIDSNALVSDIVLEILENGKEITMCEFKIAIPKAINKIINSSPSFLPSIESKYCKCCNEDLPIAAFGITQRNDGKKQIFQSYCSSCMYKKTLANLKKNRIAVRERNKPNIKKYRQKRSYKLYQAVYMKNYFKNNKEKRNEIQRRYRANKKAALKMLLK